MKHEFIQEMLNDMPDTISNFLQTPIGEIQHIPMPQSKDAAIIACGQLAANLNNALLMPFGGLTPVEMMMRVGSMNPVFISSLLGGLEAIAGGGGLKIIAPKSGSVNPNYFLFTCTCSGRPTQVNVLIDGETTIALTGKTGDTWNGSPSAPLATGKHSAMFTAQFDDGSTVSASTAFETTANMELVATFPENDTAYRPEEITKISATLNEEAATSTESLTVEVFGQAYQLVKTGATYAATYVATVAEISADFVGLNVMTVKNAVGDVLGEISFMISGEEGGD